MHAVVVIYLHAWKRRGGFSILDSIPLDCRSLLSYFDDVSLLFVCRSGYCTANALAKLPFSLGEFFWIEEVPQDLFSLVHSDILAYDTHVSS